MKKETHIILLPTEKATNIINDRDNLEFIPNKQIASTINSIVKGFHLYFLSDDEIKEEDWRYNTHTKSLIFPNTNINSGLSEYDKKIIATTDESLNKVNITSKGTFGYQKIFCSRGLPRPSNEFLEKFCELGGADKALVEYENTNKDFKWVGDKNLAIPDYGLKLSPDNTIIACLLTEN
jgi:hypothetical protein